MHPPALQTFHRLAGRAGSSHRGGTYDDFQRTSTLGLPQTTGGALPGYITEPQEQFFAYNSAAGGVVVADGQHWRFSPQSYRFHGPYGVMGEYVISNQRISTTTTYPVAANMNNTSWQIVGEWMLTGEVYSYSAGVRPAHPFNPFEGQWGAWQLVARYSELHIDDDAFPKFANPAFSAREADAWSLGLNCN